MTKSSPYEQQIDEDENSSNSDVQEIDENSSKGQEKSLNWIDKLAYASVGLPYSMQLSIIAFYINFFLLDVANVRQQVLFFLEFLSKV